MASKDEARIREAIAAGLSDRAVAKRLRCGRARVASIRAQEEAGQRSSGSMVTPHDGQEFPPVPTLGNAVPRLGTAEPRHAEPRTLGTEQADADARRIAALQAQVATLHNALHTREQQLAEVEAMLEALMSLSEDVLLART